MVTDDGTFVLHRHSVNRCHGAAMSSAPYSRLELAGIHTTVTTQVRPKMGIRQLETCIDQLNLKSLLKQPDAIEHVPGQQCGHATPSPFYTSFFLHMHVQSSNAMHTRQNIHPTQPRVLTILEQKRCQGFPGGCWMQRARAVSQLCDSRCIVLQSTAQSICLPCDVFCCA